MNQADQTPVQRNRTMLLKLGVFAVAMFGFGYAMVPFYKAICEVTGINSLVARDTVENTQVDAKRTVTVELDAAVRGLPWTFTPSQRSVDVHPGQLVQISYTVRNNSAHPVAGQAIPSYGPKAAAEHFRKLECFCFTKQVLAPGESREMPVVFVLDPKLPGDLPTVTLSYTFFELNGAVPAAPKAPVTGSTQGVPGHAG